jgi:hypothetical protein
VSRIPSPEHWLERARALRVQAEGMKTPAVRAEVLLIALAYERLAEQARRQQSLWVTDIELTPVSFDPEDGA